jgi:acyl-CoA reductase-like NAD-dependent aldehyde dehydrogenase
VRGLCRTDARGILIVRDRTGNMSSSLTASEHPLFIAGEWRRSGRPLDVRSPHDQSVVGQTWLAGSAEFEEAAAAAVKAAPVMRKLPAYRRAEILLKASQELAARQEAIARQISGEAGKPLRDARIEANRAVMTFQVAAEEARRIGGEVIPLDLAPHGSNFRDLAIQFSVESCGSQAGAGVRRG